MEECTANVKIDGNIGETKAINYKLLQESPISLILFMLYIQLLFNLGLTKQRKRKFGYVDDICILTTGKTLEQNCTTLGQNY
jgi:hypothetical protein